MKLIRTHSGNDDFKILVKQLDAYLKVTDGDEHEFYNQYNSITELNHVVLAYQNNAPIGCGAFKPFDTHSVEIKRMFVIPEARALGVGREILDALEAWAKELGYSACVLETGKRQIEAVTFYQNCAYTSTPKYGQYIGRENSLCFKKYLNHDKKKI